MGSLKGKMALVAGASSGIGAETARYFASLGCYLSLSGRNEANLKTVAEECQQNGLPKDKFFKMCEHTHAMGRHGNVDEVAKVIAFLAFDDSSYVTREVITVDVGRHLLTVMTPEEAE